MAHQTTQQTSREMQECIDECLRCHGICLQTVSHCLELGGKHADPTHIGLLLDGAEISRAGAEDCERNRRCQEFCERMAA